MKSTKQDAPEEVVGMDRVADAPSFDLKWSYVSDTGMKSLQIDKGCKHGFIRWRAFVGELSIGTYLSFDIRTEGARPLIAKQATLRGVRRKALGKNRVAVDSSRYNNMNNRFCIYNLLSELKNRMYHLPYIHFYMREEMMIISLSSR